MTKLEFVNVFAEKTGDTKKKATENIDSILGTIEDVLKTGDSVQFVGWGSFEVKDTAERMGRNPKTGVEIKIPAKKAVKFKAGKNLTDRVNK